MGIIDAVYRHGVFEPVQPVDLPEGEHVKVDLGKSVQNGLAERAAQDQWFAEVQALQASIRARHGGLLPDSTVDVAEDRMR